MVFCCVFRLGRMPVYTRSQSWSDIIALATIGLVVLMSFCAANKKGCIDIIMIIVEYALVMKQKKNTSYCSPTFSRSNLLALLNSRSHFRLKTPDLFLSSRSLFSSFTVFFRTSKKFPTTFFPRRSVVLRSASSLASAIAILVSAKIFRRSSF